MNNSQPEAMIAVREERIRIGATEVEQKTVVATTPDGSVWPTTLIKYNT